MSSGSESTSDVSASSDPSAASGGAQASGTSKDEDMVLPNYMFPAQMPQFEFSECVSERLPSFAKVNPEAKTVSATMFAHIGYINRLHCSLNLMRRTA